MPDPSRQRVQILHIDDEPDFADLTKTFLQTEDNRFDVETATSADEGLSIINDRPPDCIVSDYNMPGMDGLELLEAVRRDNPDLPFILFTGRGSEEVASDAIAADVTDYLQKGSGSEKYELLANRIRNAVRTRRETRRADRQEQLMRLTEFAADTGGFELDRESGSIRLTAGTRRIIGRSDKFAIHLEEARELFAPDEHEDIQQTLERAFETGEKLHDEWRLQPGDGDERLLDITITPVVKDGGQVAKLRGAVNDITAKKTRERRLAELNQATQALLAAETRQEVADIGVEAASDILDLKANAIHVSEADDTQLVPVAQTDEVATIAGGTTVLPVTDSIAGRVYRDGKPEVIEDVREDPDTYDTDTALRGYLYLPLADHGVLIAGSEKQAAFDQQHLALGELLAGTLVAALDRVKRKQTARQRQQELALFFEESPLGAVQWDDKFRFERLNARAEEILGYDESELRGESWETIVAPDDHDKVNTVVKNLLDADGGTHAFNRNVRKDDELLTGEWHNRAVTDEDGNVQSIFSKFQDVTERENRKRELEEYETIIEALTDAVYVIDENGHFTYVNDKFIELVGYDRETILGNTPSLIKDEEPVEQAEHQLGRLLSSDGPETVTFEVMVHPRDGDPIDCEDQMGVLPYDGERFNGSVGTLRDLTHRKKREQELQELKNQYETLVENFPDGAVFLINADLECVRAGGKELRNVGLSPDDVEGMTPHDLFPEDIGDELGHYYEEGLDGNANTFEQEYGGERYRIQTVPVRTDDGGIEYVMAVSQNITEDAEDKQRLERQNERLEEFTGLVSHDLRNPLRVADGRLELVRDECESDHIDDVAQALDRMDTLIEDLLTLAQEGERVDETDPVGLTDVATNSWQTVDTEQAALEADASRTLKADQRRLRQLFENIYRNAVEHSDETVTVSVGTVENGFYVADTGPGIPKDDREHVFGAGYSTNEGGTGFGLRIVEQIADAHNWEITVTESEQGGARFEITGVEFVD
jgi:PAS domain S-box-containing protein